MKKIIVLPDAHIGITTPNAYQVAKQFIKDEKPDEIVILGDFADCESFSDWDMDKKRLMEGRRWKKEVTNLNNELDFLQKHSKKITYIGGNHEWRVERYLDKHPEMEGMIEVELMLRLKERGIDYIPYTEQRMYYTGKLYYTHGYYTNQYFAKKNLETFGCNIVSGHLHKPQTFFSTSKMSEPKMSWGLGCLCSREPDYLKGRPSTSNNGFGIAYVKDNGHFSFYPINMAKNGSFLWQSKEYGKKNK